MQIINPNKLMTFFMSLGWAGDYPDPEPIHGGIVRMAKGHLAHLPLMKLEYRTKQEFVDRAVEIAEQLWDAAKQQP